MNDLKIGLVTKEWPPAIYGGAGVHVVELTRALRSIQGVSVDVHCFGGSRSDACGYSVPSQFVAANPALQALVTDVEIASHLGAVNLVHSHTWYANMAGHIAALQQQIPHVVTAHSLEPFRPWKHEQLGGGYAISSWAEKTAYEAANAIIAVSDAMRADVLSAYPSIDPNKVITIRNGVDTTKFAPKNDPSVLSKYGIIGRYSLFVGRITRQKGLIHLLRAWRNVPTEYGLVLAAGSPDEESIGSEVAQLIAELQEVRRNIWWIREKLPHDELTSLLTAADLFICPSVYEPLGIVNLEAMGCETAVLASRVGGIPEVVANKVSGELVDYSGDGPEFESELAQSITRLMSQPELLIKYGAAGRVRAVEHFGWDGVAKATVDLYRRVIT